MVRKHRFFIIASGVVAALAVFLYLQNHWIQTSFYTYRVDRDSGRWELRSVKAETSPVSRTDGNAGMPADKVRIVHLSDLHAEMFGPSNRRLLARTAALAPDIIVVTGDWIDQYTVNRADAAKTLGDLRALAPVFYSPGNHEFWRGDLQGWQDELRRYGLQMMQNRIESLEIDGKDLPIHILGLDESAVAPDSDASTELFDALAAKPGIRIVLAHYPENFAMLGADSYDRREFDLMFAGHAHGGQIRLPLVGGLLSPGEGWFPDYYSGSHDGSRVHASGQRSRMIISRGLGNSLIPQRLFNRPEIVVVDLFLDDPD